MKVTKKEMLLLTAICLSFLVSPVIVNASNIYVLDVCSNILGKDLADILNYIFQIIRIVVPILVVILITIDFTKAVVASKEDDMKKARQTAIKRIIVGVIIFFVPTIVKIILWLIGRTDSACTFG